MKYFCAGIAGLAVVASSAAAQDFRLTGGEIGAGYYDSDIDGLSGNSTAFQASVGFALREHFGVQLGFAFDDYEITSAPSANLHGYYSTGNGKFGFFTSYKSLEDVDSDITSYGLEGMFTAGPLTFELRGGTADVSDTNVSFDFAGANLYYAWRNNLDVTAEAKFTSIDSVLDITELSVGADYYASDRVRLGASFGQIRLANAGLSETGSIARLEVSFLFGGRGQRLFRNQGPLDTLLNFGL